MNYRENLARAAGFFNGEGCFSLSVRYMYAVGSVSQKTREELDLFVATVGFGNVSGPYTAKKPDRSWYLYQAFGYEKVQALAAMLWPWLSRQKKEDAKRVLKAHITARPEGYGVHKRGHYPYRIIKCGRPK